MSHLGMALKMIAQHESEPGATVGDVLAKLPVNEWANFGDINYLQHGGVQLRWDGDDLVDFVDFSVPGDNWYLSEGTVPIGTLVENGEDLYDRYGMPINWPIAEMKFSEWIRGAMRFGDAEDIHEDPEKLIWLIETLPSYGGFADRDRVLDADVIALDLSEESRVEITAEEVLKDMISNEKYEQLEDAMGGEFSLTDYVETWLKEQLPTGLEGV